MDFPLLTLARKSRKPSVLQWLRTSFVILLAGSFGHSSQASIPTDTIPTEAKREEVIFLTPHPYLFPWVSYSDEKGFQGIMHDTLAEAAKRSGINLVIQGEPIKRIFKSLLDGLGDFALIPLPLPNSLLDNKELSTHPHPVIRVNLALFGMRGVHPNSFSISDTQTSYQIGIQNLPSTNIEALLPQSRHIWTSFHSIPALIKALETNRIDLILAPGITTIAESSRLGAANDIELIHEFKSLNDFSLIWSNNSPIPSQSPTAIKFKAALDTITCDGTVDKIIQRYWHTLEDQHLNLNTAKVTTAFSQSFKPFCPK